MANLEIPTPSPLGRPSDGSPSLSERINIATRSIHSQLNKLILVRLPLALPPYASSPSIYATGLSHVAPIYITFESLWQAILDLPRLPTSPSQTATLHGNREESFAQDLEGLRVATNAQAAPAAYGRKACPRVHSLLSHLHLPGLLRAQRLRADIRDLTGMSEPDIEDQLDGLSRDGKLAEFIAHAKKAVESKPHVLLAYAWVFYMALFSGGRYLRAALAEAGGEGAGFWNHEPLLACPGTITEDAARPRRTNTSELDEHAASSTSRRSRSRFEIGASVSIPGLRFFNFAGEADGEDIKLEFKKRIVEAEILLTSGEKEHIIAEAESIFNFMVEVVLELDRVVDCPSTASTLSVHEAALFHSQEDNVDARKESLEKKPLGRPHSKGEHVSSLFGSAKDTRRLGSTWTKWLTSLVPMVLCIVLTSWYYGM